MPEMFATKKDQLKKMFSMFPVSCHSIMLIEPEEMISIFHLLYNTYLTERGRGWDSVVLRERPNPTRQAYHEALLPPPSQVRSVDPLADQNGQRGGGSHGPTATHNVLRQSGKVQEASGRGKKINPTSVGRPRTQGD